MEVLLEFVGAVGGGDAAARGFVGLSGESFEVLLKIAHLTVIIKTDKYDKSKERLGGIKGVSFPYFCMIDANY